MLVRNSSVSLRCTLGAPHLAPCRKGSIMEQSVVQCAHQMPPEPKEIINRTVHREKPLDVAWGFEPPHLALSLASGLLGRLQLY